MTDIKQLELASEQVRSKEEKAAGQEPWRELIGEGWIWTARARKVQWIGGLALFGLVASVTYDMTSNLFAAARPLPLQQQYPVTTGDRFFREPVVTVVNGVRGWMPDGSDEATARPKYRKPVLFLVTNNPVKVEGTGTFGNYHDYLTAQVAALNERGELEYECTPFATIGELEYKLDGQTVYCKQGADAWYFAGAALWTSTGWSNELKGNFGVIKKHDDAGWQFHNIESVVGSGFRPVYKDDTGKGSDNGKTPLGGIVNPDMIADTMSRDFPDLFVFAEKGGKQ